MFASEDDPWIPIQEASTIYHNLGCEYHEYKNEGRFSSIDDKTFFSPDMVVWTEDAPKWNLFDPDVKKFKRSSI